MKNKIKDLKRNDVTQNKIALCFLLEYGRISLTSNSIVSSIKEKTKKQNNKNSMINAEYLEHSIDIARDIAQLNFGDLCKFVYYIVKEEKKRERGR